MLLDDFSENKVTIQKFKLLDIMKSNREKHERLYQEALVGYREATILRLEEMLKEAKSNGKVKNTTDLESPRSHTKDYDLVIKMLELSTKDEITISGNQFNQYVEDEWAWKNSFVSNASIYSKR